MKKRILIFSIIFLGMLFLFANSQSAKAAEKSNCDDYNNGKIFHSECTGGQDAGAQSGCDNLGDADILENQCKCQYSESSCSNMTAYLKAMTAECNKKKPSGIDCDMISKNGFYGRVASAFAVWEKDNTPEKNPTVKTPVASTPGCGAGTETDGAITFVNPLCYDSLSEVLMAILVNLQGFLALIAIIIIIIGGMMYMFSAGNETMVTRAKATIGGALIGLSIILAAPSFLKQIKLVLGGNWKGTNPDQIVNQAYTFRDIAISVINFLLSIIGILGIIALVVGGVMYVTAYGNEDRVESGKKIIGNALIGILIAFAALILVKQIAALLGAG